MGDERDPDYHAQRRVALGLRPLPPPMSGKKDPETSARAAAEMQKGGKISESERVIALEICNWPDGLTACELAEKLAGRWCRKANRDQGWWRLECSRRLGRMADRHSMADGQFVRWTLVRSSIPRRCRVAGTVQTVWLPRRLP